MGLVWGISVVLGLLCQTARAWYIPGSAPVSYEEGDKVPLLVNALSPLSDAPEVNSLISYDYYTPSFHFCKPPDIRDQPESLGSILSGDRLYNSPFDLRMKKAEQCRKLCSTTVPASSAKFINERINQHYAIHWLVDGLPAAKARFNQNDELVLSIGFNLGYKDQFTSQSLVNNHYEILIDYHERGPGDLRIVGVLVSPSSKAHNGQGDCAEEVPLHLEETQDTDLAFTYDVTWRKSETTWATRWDSILKIRDPKVHWLSLINSLVVAFFLCAMVLVVLNKASAKDIDRFNAIDLGEDVQEEYGWKLVAGEVFRQPQRPMLLSVVVGTGSQLAGMILVTLGFAMLGFLSPSSRGSLAQALFFFLLLFSFVGGYVSTRVYLTCEGPAWRQNALATAMIFPGAIFASVNFLNLFLVASGSSGAIPVGTLLAVVSLWFAISLPLTYIGAFIALRHGAVKQPARVNQIPRQIPPTPKIVKTWPAALLGGIFSFMVGYLELFFILTSLFGSRAYYAFGFLGGVYVITSFTAATTSILLIYFRLCSENYRWQWQSIAIGGGGSLWILGYGVIFGFTRLSLVGLSSKMIFLIYLVILASVNFLINGSIGFLATYFFLRRIYSRVRLD